mgnify:CR=1 FL=1
MQATIRRVLAFAQSARSLIRESDAEVILVVGTELALQTKGMYDAATYYERMNEVAERCLLAQASTDKIQLVAFPYPCCLQAHPILVGTQQLLRTFRKIAWRCILRTLKSLDQSLQEHPHGYVWLNPDLDSPVCCIWAAALDVEFIGAEGGSDGGIRTYYGSSPRGPMPLREHRPVVCAWFWRMTRIEFLAGPVGLAMINTKVVI